MHTSLNLHEVTSNTRHTMVHSGRCRHRRHNGSIKETHIYSCSHICIKMLSSCYAKYHSITANRRELDRRAPSISRENLYACTLTRNMHAHFPSSVPQPCLPTHCILNQAWQRTPQVSSVLMAALGPASVLCVCVCQFSLCWALVSLKSLFKQPGSL